MATSNTETMVIGQVIIHLNAWKSGKSRAASWGVRLLLDDCVRKSGKKPINQLFDAPQSPSISAIGAHEYS